MRFEKTSRILLVCAAIYAIVFIVFFPHYFVSIDENEYLQNAIRFSQGRVGEPDLSLSCAPALQNDNGFVSAYYPGKSLFLVPFLPIGLNAIMTSGLIVHLLGFFAFYKILQRLKFNELFSLLFLFFPPLVYLSRTLFTENLVLLLGLTGVYYYLGQEKKEFTLSGLFLGLACVVRYDALLFIAPFFAVNLFKERKKLFWMAAGIALPAIAILWFNSIAYGNPFSTGYGNPASILSRSTDWIRVLLNFAYFFGASLLVLPFLSTGAFVKKKNLFWETLGVLALYLVFFSKLTNISVYAFFDPITFTGRLRNIIPALGLLLLSYPALWNFVSKKIAWFDAWKNKLLALLVVILFFGTVALSALHAPLVNDRFALRNQIQEHVPLNAMLVGSADDCIYAFRNPTNSYHYLNFVPPARLGENVSYSFPEAINGETYFLEVAYAQQKGRTGFRQTIIDAERAPIHNFIQSNPNDFELAYSASEPHDVNVWRWID